MKKIATGAEKSPKKNPRKKLAMMHDDEEDEGERTELDTLSKLQIVPRQPSMDNHQVDETIRNLVGLIGFKHIRYDSLDMDNEKKIEKDIYK